MLLSSLMRCIAPELGSSSARQYLALEPGGARLPQICGTATARRVGPASLVRRVVATCRSAVTVQFREGYACAQRLQAAQGFSLVQHFFAWEGLI